MPAVIEKSVQTTLFRKPCGYSIHQYGYFISQLKCPKFRMITHDVPLTSFGLHPIYLSSYTSRISSLLSSRRYQFFIEPCDPICHGHRGKFLHNSLPSQLTHFHGGLRRIDQS